MGGLWSKLIKGIKECWGKPLLDWGVYYVVTFLLLIILFFVLRPWFRRSHEKLKNLHLGLMAEQLVGQQLESCRTALHYVFHDVVVDKGGRRFNIDHVAIGPGGVFVVETKGKRKPLRGETKIKFDGRQLQFSDGSFTDDPIRQCEANTAYIQNLLMGFLKDKKNPVCKFDGRNKMPMVPVVVYPGWFIDYGSANGAQIRISNEKSLPNMIEKWRPVLSNEEVRELGILLGNHLRQERRHLVNV
jgi:hypothetical protein